MNTNPARTSATTTTDDQRAVRHVIEAYAEGMRAGNVAGIVDLYTDDAAVMAPDMPSTVGRDQLSTVYQGALGAVSMDFTFTFDEMVLRGDTAVARTHTDGKNTVLATGAEVPARYRELFVLNREGGSWKIAQYMFHPQPEQEALNGAQR